MKDKEQENKEKGKAKGKEKDKESKGREIGEIIEVEITKEMEKAYADYAMSVIVSRALPSAEDGLKPVQRRILYTMKLLGMYHNKPTKKTARVVGEVLGKLHPHGDIAVYDALVRMAQNFTMRYPLIEGQGNFGSIDGDAPAAMRYTECRLNAIAEEILKDIEKDTIEMIPNFDNTMQEPIVLPSSVPNLLISGSQGIAVGMTTNIPPHNLNETIDAILAYINNQEISIDELLKYIKAPDFPTGGIVFTKGIRDVYNNGFGKIVMRGIIDIEKKENKKAIIIKELPYQVNKASLVAEIAKLIENKKISDISDLRDESSKDGIRIVLQLRKDANEKIIINRLYRYTLLETNFNAIFVALVNGVPRLLNLKDMIKVFVDHRINVVKRRTQFDLNEATERKHLLEGFLIALKNIDKVIDIIKKAESVANAEKALSEKFNLSKKQAQAILEMKLSKLTKIETEKVVEEKAMLEKKIAELSEILKSEKNILDVIKKELIEIKKKYGDERRTKLVEEKKEVEEIELIKKEDIVVTLSYKGYINVIGLDEFREQKRGGKGIVGVLLTDNDYVNRILICSTHDNILLITNRGNAFLLKAYEIQKSSRYGKGKHISNLLSIKPEEKIKTVLMLKEEEQKATGKGCNENKSKKFILIVTRKGMIKKLALSELASVRRIGLRVIKLPFDDEIIEAFVLDEDKDIIIATKKGMAVRFNTSEIRSMGRTAYGVTAIKLKQDEVVDMTIANEKEDVLTITNRGFGKKSPVIDYRKTKRAASGIKNISLSERNGYAVCCRCVSEKDSIMLITKNGMVIRFNAEDIRRMGRATQGVKIIRLKQNDEVIDVDIIKESEKKLEENI